MSFSLSSDLGMSKLRGDTLDLLNLIRVLWTHLSPEQSYLLPMWDDHKHNVLLWSSDCLISLLFGQLQPSAAGKGLLGFYLSLQSTEPELR